MAIVRCINIVSMVTLFILVLFFSNGARFMLTATQALDRYEPAQWQTIYEDVVSKSTSDDKSSEKSLTLMLLGYNGCVANADGMEPNNFVCFYNKRLVTPFFSKFIIPLTVITLFTTIAWHAIMQIKFQDMDSNYRTNLTKQMLFKRLAIRKSTFKYWSRFSPVDKIVGVIQIAIFALLPLMIYASKALK